MSSHDRKAGLDGQVAQLTARGQRTAGGQVVWVEAEAGSGMYGSRTRGRRLLADPEVRARIGREQAAVHDAAVYRATQLARRAFGGEHG